MATIPKPSALARAKADVKKHSPMAMDMNFPKPPAKDSEQPPDIRELIADRKAVMQVVSLSASYSEAAKTEKEARAAKDTIGKRLKTLLSDNEVGKCVAGDYRLNYFNAPRTTLSEKLLLAANVSPLIIAKCKETKDVYQLRVTAIGQEDEE